MRRKSERAASSKKVKSSPERKTEPVKRTRSRRSKKPSTSSDNESANDETLSTVKEVEIVAPIPKTPVKADNTEESPEQVWQVKSALTPADTGEIQKLKICLTRPPSTPERADRSPRSKRKSRATSSSDAHSVDGSEEKRKSRHRKKSTRQSKEESEISHDSQNEEIKEVLVCEEQPESSEPLSTKKSTDKASDNNEKMENDKSQDCEMNSEQQEIVADTTVVSPNPDSMEQVGIASLETTNNSLQMNVDTEENTLEEDSKEKDTKLQDVEEVVESTKEKVSKVIESAVPSGEPHSPMDNGKVNNDHDVLEIECTQYETEKDPIKELDNHQESSRVRTLERTHSTSVKPEQEETNITNGPPIVVNRKRKWGSRPGKIVSQKSITISTDVLKDIIPDVKPVDMTEVIEEKKPARRVDVRERIEIKEKYEKPILPKIVIDNTDNVDRKRDEKENLVVHEPLTANRKISIVKHDDVAEVPLSPPRNKQSCILYITNLVRPFTIPQLKNLLQRTGRIEADGFWINRIKSKCFVKYETEDQAVETRHALHGVTWPVSNPKSLQVDFSTDEAFEKARENEDNENTQTSAIPGTVEDWLREQDKKREKGEVEPKPWEKKNVREWDMGKGDKANEEKAQRNIRDERLGDRRRIRTPERSPEPAKKFKKKEEEAPAKLLDDLFRKTKATPCIYWLPLSDETIAIKEEQRRKHMAEHERRLSELRRTRRH